MAQKKIIIDSNCYFRLAQNLHPLLCVPFGPQQFTLYIHASLNDEFRRSPRLQNKFHWVIESSYVENRNRSISLNQEQKKEVENTYEYLWEYVKENFIFPLGKGPSPIDTTLVAVANVLNIQLATDDGDMIKLAKYFSTETISSLGLLKLMLDSNHIDNNKVDMVVEQWIYENDTPNRKWRTEFKKVFGRDAPSGY